MPTVRAVTYVETRDELVPKRRPATECAQLYRSVVSQISLLVVRDLFEADPRLRQVCFNGMIHRTNLATGHREYPCLISLIVERHEFAGLALEQVSPEQCLKRLKARISDTPAKWTASPLSSISTRPGTRSSTASMSSRTSTTETT